MTSYSIVLPKSSLRFAPCIACIVLLNISCIAKAHYQQLLEEKTQLEHQLQSQRLSLSASQLECEAAIDKSTNLENQNINLRNTNQVLSKKNLELSSQMVAAQEQTLLKKKELSQRQLTLEQATKTYDELVQDLKQEVEAGKITIQNMQDQLKVMLVERIVFPAGTVELNENGKAVLKKVAKVLKNITDRRIQVEGHSDASPVSQELHQLYPSNWELSARRATSVVRFLQDQGVDPKLLAAVALAHYHPIASNKTTAGRQSNRRIEIVLTPLLENATTAKP